MKIAPLILLVVATMIAIATLTPTSTFAQDSPTKPDSTKGLDPSDSIVLRKNGKVVTIESYAARYNPRLAMLYSAVLPGLGQVYNGKYWKVPLVYSAFGGLGYGVWFNQTQYLKYRKGLFGLLNEPTNPVVDPTTGLTKYGNTVVNGEVLFPVRTNVALRQEVVRNAVNKYRRDRDYMLIMTFLFYMLQMVDAHVDAHLKEFDLNPQLQVSIEPAMNQNAFTGRTFGGGIVLKF